MAEQSFTWELSRDHCPWCRVRFNKVGVLYKDGSKKRVKVGHKKIVVSKDAELVLCLNCGRAVELSSELNHLGKGGKGK